MSLIGTLDNSAHLMATSMEAPGAPAPTTPSALASGPIPVREVVGADEVALWLGVDRKTVYNAAARGEIPHRRLGKRLLFSRTALVSWLACEGGARRKDAQDER
jgi:excisionase family DNA binding protein